MSRLRKWDGLNASDTLDYSSSSSSRFPGVQRCLDDYGSCATDGGASAANEDDDDFDLFGSDDEEEVREGGQSWGA